MSASGDERSAPGVEVSIVIPCLNGVRTLGEQLRALSAQTDAPSYEVIVSDNGSTDGTQELVRNWAAHVPGLRLVDSSSRQCAAHARNVGALNAGGTILAFCDADDAVDARWVREMVLGLEQFDVVSGWLSFERFTPAHLEAGSIERELPIVLGYLPSLSGSNWGIRRKLFIEMGGMDESLPLDEDVDFAWRAAEAGHSLGCVPALVHYRPRVRPLAVYRQYRGYSEASIALWARYRDRPLRPVGFRGSVRQVVVQLLRGAAVTRDPLSRWRFARDLGSHVGAVRGHIRYRILGSVPPPRFLPADSLRE